MSALDQAIIKAYAKPRPAAAPVADAIAAARPAGVAQAFPSANPAPSDRAGKNAYPTLRVEQLYGDGTLYRVETPANLPRAASRVPAPHLPNLPPTSPRRNVRRSMLRLLAASHTPEAIETPIEQPPRVARKVIIRHISHAAAPPPLGMLRPAGIPENAASAAAVVVSRAELPPETIADEPAPAPMELPVPSPVAPHAAPLNIALHTSQAIEIRGDWDHESVLAPMMVISDAPSGPATIVNVQLDALEAAEKAVESTALDSSTVRFTPKSLEDRDEPRIEIRIDAPHAHGRHRPHARFGAANEAPIADAPIEEAQPQPQPLGEELTFAEQQSEALASDLLPLDEALDVEVASDAAAVEAVPAAAARPAVPLWEVDRFHWPRTCEKLLADEHGYLSRAGDKLLAAVQDGLKVLAITGTRRGEGRTTLSLCLARAAAKAGIQTAVMDADFARPNLASKIGLEIAFGWQDAALGRIPLSEAAVKSLADNITLMPLESSAATRALSLADPRVTATIRAAAATFELLILDLGPLGAGEPIAFPLGEACPLDAAIVVRDLRFTTATESEAIGHRLQDAGIEAVGIAENFVIDEEIPATSV
jgi:Mrp family chromosome partitioning ATPase